MSAIGPVIECFESAHRAECQKDYLLAARYYLVCDLFYQNGELPFYMEQVQQYGESALSHYWDCYHNLTKESQQMLKDEYLSYHSNWRKFTNFEFERICIEADHQLLPEKKT